MEGAKENMNFKNYSNVDQWIPGEWYVDTATISIFEEI